jgi:predicted nucleic acid-binding protein
MPARLVVDASALAAVLFEEPEAPQIVVQLGDSILVAPTLLAYEMSNICWKKLRRHPERRAAILEAYALMGRMEIEEVDVSMPAALLLADRENLTVYDASYLWLSRALGVELITLDARLKAAASSK